MKKDVLSDIIETVIKMIKAIFIDIDDTLLDFSKCAEYAIKESCKDFGLSQGYDIFPVFEKINAELWQQIEKGEITKSQLYGHRWVTVLEKFGITHIDGQKFEEHFLEHLSKSAEKIDGATEILTYLSKKYKIYASSNGPHEQQLNRLKKAGLLQYFDDVFTSELIGVQKPEKEFFDACIRKIGNITPDETILIGDSLTADISGGINFNIPTIWLNTKNKDVRAEVTPTHTVKALNEIKNIL